MPRHKYLDHKKHNVANTLNYMCAQWESTGTGRPRRTEFTFRGLLPIPWEWNNWGVTLDDQDYAAVHVFEQDWHWGDHPQDTETLAKDRPWVVMFYGSDNASFFCRFKTREEAVEFFEGLNDVPPQDSLIYYNS